MSRRISWPNIGPNSRPPDYLLDEEGGRSGAYSRRLRRGCAEPLGIGESEMLTVQDYATWAAKQVLERSPASLTADWGRTRTDAIATMGPGNIFETLSLCCALCEFLGALYLGIQGDSGSIEFKAFVDEFFPPEYRTVHNLSGQAGATSEFYTTFRSKTLHGGTPAGVTLPGNVQVIGWQIGTKLRAEHLKVINAALHVDGEQFREDLTRAAAQYADRLQADVAMQERWRRGFWWRFKPLHLPKADWEREGNLRGIPASSPI